MEGCPTGRGGSCYVKAKDYGTSLFFFLGFCLTFFPASAWAVEHVHFRHRGEERNEEGRIILETPEGLALEARDGQFYVIKQENIMERTSDEIPFAPYSKAEMMERLREEFPKNKGFYLIEYDPFIVVYTTSRPFANWFGGLFRRLHEQYAVYWKRNGVELSKPEFPLVAVVLSSEERYRQYAQQEGVKLSKGQCAFYHKLTNRIAMYDMSGEQAFQEGNQHMATAADIQRFLAHPNSLSNIRVVIHEAVHQVGYNTGMHSRHAPNPVWLCEGLAILHEVPDLKNRFGWTPGPHVNYYRLAHLRQYLGKPHRESPILKMIQDDDLFRTPDSALDNYALAWGLTYFLVKKHPKELVAYLKILQEKMPDSDDSKEIRINDFESCFGDDGEKLHKEFYEFVRKL
ncbi:MAG: DUF1570 domain-containing protein [Planctomycetaceae bacterium]|nr:DUF1570 domain-containing protein [Planctomycetaceae bacterium]